jgi:hypothetical protein
VLASCCDINDTQHGHEHGRQKGRHKKMVPGTDATTSMAIAVNTRAGMNSRRRGGVECSTSDTKEKLVAQFVTIEAINWAPLG